MAAKLVLSVEGQVLRELMLEKERVTIGRKAHNDIQVDNLAVSGEHAAIITILNDSFMEDLGSTNGTYVNGQSVKRHFLQDGDVIEIGKHKLKYINEVRTNTTAEEFERTMVMRRPQTDLDPAAPGATIVERSTSDTQVGARTGVTTAVNATSAVRAPDVGRSGFGTSAGADLAGATGAASPALGMGVVRVLSGPNAGRSLELTKTLTTLGKPGLQVAVITKRPTGYYLTHVEGAKFPVLNGSSIGAAATALKDNDVIEIASVKMEFFVKT